MKKNSVLISNTTLCIVYVNVMLYATCYQLQRPIEPFLVEKLSIAAGGSTQDVQSSYMRLQSFFSVLQMLGSLCIGVIIDKIGSRGGFILCFACSALSYGILSCATTMQLLFLSKIPTAFQAGFLCAQSAVIETTTEGSERVTALGRLTVCYTVGSIIGPFLGGWIGASGDYYIGAYASVAGSLLSIVLCFFMQHPSNSVDHTHKMSPDGPSAIKKASAQFPYNLLTVVRRVSLLLGTKLVSGIANSIASTTLPLIMKDSYGLNETGLGVSMSTMSAFNALVNGVLLSPITKFFRQDLLALISFALRSMFCFYFVQFVFSTAHFTETLAVEGYYPFFITCIILSMYQYVLGTVITSESSARVDDHEKGTLIGLEHSLFALARIWTDRKSVV